MRVLELEAKRSLRIVRGFAPPPSRLLEIGCATGEFCRLASDAGYEVEGIELSEPAAQFARENYGLHVQALPLAALQGRMKPFDLVVAIHTLEHFSNPQEAVAQVYELLRPGGRLFVEVPSVDSWAVRWRGEKSGVFTDEHHVLHSEQSLRILLETGGFSAMAVRSTEGYLGLFNTFVGWLGFFAISSRVVTLLRAKRAPPQIMENRLSSNCQPLDSGAGGSDLPPVFIPTAVGDLPSVSAP